MLDSVVEADGPDPLYLDTFEAVPRVLRALCRASCRAFTPDPVADSATLVRAARPRGRCAGRVRRTAAERLGARALRRADLFVVLRRGRLRSRPARGVPGRRARRARRRRRAAAAPAPARLRGGRRAAPAARAQQRAVRGHHLRGDAVPVAAHEPARPRPRRAAGSRGRGGAARTAPSSRSIAPPRCDNDLLELCDRWPRRRPRPFSEPARCRTCRCCCSRARTTCARRSRARGGWRPGSRVRRLVVAPATGHSALGADLSGCTTARSGASCRERPSARAARAGGATSCHRLRRRWGSASCARPPACPARAAACSPPSASPCATSPSTPSRG